MVIDKRLKICSLLGPVHLNCEALANTVEGYIAATTVTAMISKCTLISADVLAMSVAT